MDDVTPQVPQGQAQEEELPPLPPMLSSVTMWGLILTGLAAVLGPLGYWKLDGQQLKDLAGGLAALVTGIGTLVVWLGKVRSRRREQVLHQRARSEAAISEILRGQLQQAQVSTIRAQATADALQATARRCDDKPLNSQED